MQTLKTFLRADIRLDLTEENVSKVVYWGVGKGTFFTRLDPAG